MSKVTKLHTSNKFQENLDRKITALIKTEAQKTDLSPADIAGVFRAIEFRLFFGEFYND